MPHDEGHEIQDAPPSRDGGWTGDGIPDLPYVRLTQRAHAPRDRRRIWTVLALVLAGHLLLAWFAYAVLRAKPHPPGRLDAISVMLFDSSGPPPPPPPLAPPPPLPGQPPPAAPQRRLHYVPPAKGAMKADLEGVQGPPLDLYDDKGRVRLPPESSGQPAPAYTARVPTGSKGLTVKNPVPYKPTRFNKDWAPVDQTLGGKVLDEVIDKTTVKKTVHLPGGIKIHCSANPLLAFAGGLLGCHGNPPPPPPRNDDDIRLSMPPAESLTGKKVAVPRPAASSPTPAASAPAPAASSPPPAPEVSG